MLELLLVLTVTLLLTSLLLPALGELRENAHRVVCSSNLRQTGLGVVMWADDHGGALPRSVYSGKHGNKQEMMAAHLGFDAGDWEGLGWLFAERYIDAPEIFHCPSHTGDHPYAKYHHLYFRYRHTGMGGPPIYTNYHYTGDRDWETHMKRSLAKEPTMVIAIDGLRTVRDFNHQTGFNVLHGDSSVIWREDPTTRRVARLLPAAANDDFSGIENDYREIWRLIVRGG